MATAVVGRMFTGPVSLLVVAPVLWRTFPIAESVHALANDADANGHPARKVTE